MISSSDFRTHEPDFFPAKILGPNRNGPQNLTSLIVTHWNPVIVYTLDHTLTT